MVEHESLNSGTGYCCCCDSRTATLTGNWVILGGGLLFAMLYIFAIGNGLGLAEKDPNYDQDWPFFSFALALQVVKITCASFAIYGINHGKRGFVTGTFVFISLMMLLECVLILFNPLIVIAIAAQFYFYWVPMHAYLVIDWDGGRAAGVRANLDDDPVARARAILATSKVKQGPDKGGEVLYSRVKADDGEGCGKNQRKKECSFEEQDIEIV